MAASFHNCDLFASSSQVGQAPRILLYSGFIYLTDDSSEIVLSYIHTEHIDNKVAGIETAL